MQVPPLMMACGKGECVFCPPCVFGGEQDRAESEAGLVLHVLCISQVVKPNSQNSDHGLWWGDEALGSPSGC